ncbi:MAG: helix-turn-helix transcriptional regulator [Syntrophomonadaceae bacterium]|nr:helix-turn-helix transcriptional regulator [Syntrophomonadaceae bacterium]
MPIYDFIKSNTMVPVADSGSCCVFQMKNESGEGFMTVYEVFPGVTLAYNDYHMKFFESDTIANQDLLCIDHCKEGRIEYAIGAGKYSYVEVGDLKIDRLLDHSGCFEFPLSHYHGITIAFQMKEVIKTLPEEIRDFPVDINAICKKFCYDTYPIVIHDAPSIGYVLEGLYNVPEQIKQYYFKVKILELLLYLDALEIPKNKKEQPYFYKSQVEKIKAIQALISEHPEQHYTQEYLSKQFKIPLTPMKKCFKNVYGNPINTYMRISRVNKAAVLLRQNPSSSVTEIAGNVGYDSPSKFAAAFKNIMGQTPLEYRKNFH